MSSEDFYQNYNAPQESFNMIQPQHDPRTMVAFSNFPQQCEPSVLMVSGLDQGSLNTLKLFNLISLYGNVMTIQFLPNQHGTAIIQMFDQMSADCCIRYLNNALIGPYSRIKVSWSNQNYQPCGEQAFRLSDGNTSFQDFTESKNQRFLIPRPTYWIQPPSNVVRFYNTPSHMHVELLKDVFLHHNIQPNGVKFFPVDENSRSTRGLLEFASIPQAIQAIMTCNNLELKTATNGSQFMKLCFSSSHFND